MGFSIPRSAGAAEANPMLHSHPAGPHHFVTRKSELDRFVTAVEPTTWSALIREEAAIHAEDGPDFETSPVIDKSDVRDTRRAGPSLDHHFSCATNPEPEGPVCHRSDDIIELGAVASNESTDGGLGGIGAAIGGLGSEPTAH